MPGTKGAGPVVELVAAIIRPVGRFVASFFTDLKARLQSLWLRRHEFVAAWRPSAGSLDAGKQRLRALWLRRRELRVGWPSASSFQSAVAASKTTRIAALGAAAIIGAAVLALTIGVPVPFLAKAIAKKFETETGYRLLIDGRAKIRLLPSAVVTVGSISVVEGQGASAQTHFAADDLRIKMSLWGLISGRPRLTEVAIGGPTFRVSLLRERAVAAAVKPSRSPSPLPQNLIVDRLIVEDGAVEFVNPAGGVEGRVDDIALTGSLSGDRTLAAKASGRLGEQEVRAELKGKLPAGLDGGQPAALEFSLDAPGFFQDPVTGKATVRTNGRLLAINPLAGTVGQAKFSGLASVDFASKPAVKVDLDFQRLALGVAPGPVGESSTAGLGQPWSDRAVSLEALNYFDAEMQISAAELRVDRFRFAPISVGAILANGVLTAGLVRTGAYSGQIQGTLTIDASGADPSHALRVDLAGVRALPLLSDAASFDALDGRMLAKIDARSRGRSPRAIMSALGGVVDLQVQDGEIRSVNIARMIRSLAVSTLNGWQENKAEKTDLTQLSAFFRIDRGQASTDNLRMLGPLVRVTGSGTADLGAKTLQFKVDPKLVLTLQGQGGALDPLGIGVPVVVQGSWAAPRIYPDMAGILEDPAVAYAKLREMGSGLFGTGMGLPGSPDNPLAQNIETLIDRLGGDRKNGSAPAAGERLPPARPAPQAQARPQSPPPPPAQSPSQSQSTGPTGPIDFFGKLLFGR